MNLSFHFLNGWFPVFMGALLVTLKITILAAILAIFWGSVVGSMMSVRKSILLSSILQVYVSIFRNFPLLVQLFFFFYGLPLIGLRMTPFWTGVVAITLNEGAFIAEIIRGNINGISSSDWEAAQSLGLSRFHILTKVIFPQAFYDSIPALTGQISIIVKDTSLLSMIMMVELTRVANIIYNQYLSFSGFFFSATLYIALFIVLNKLSSALEQRYRVRR
jgi:His/Glu/Gln/Arg/opine family amino acid ABC transporter permease subunit